MHVLIMQGVLHLLSCREWSSHACRYNEMREAFEMDVPPEDSFVFSRVSLIAQARPFLDVAHVHTIPFLSHNAVLK